MWKVFAIFLTAIVLAACVDRSWEPDLDRTAYACREYGFYPGSQEYENCIKYVDTRRAKGAGF